MSFVVRGRSRRTLVAAAVAVVVVLGVAGWAVFLRPSDSAAAAVTYRSATVTTGTLRQSVSASGTVQATDTEDLTFPAAGQVTAVWVTAGQTVSKGQRLAAIDSATLSSEVAAARATLATAQAKLAADQAAGASSTQLVADSASITVAQGQVSSATADLAGATITAPFAGTVTSVGYAVGQQVAGSGSAGAGSGSASGAGPTSGAGNGAGSSSGSTSGTGGSGSASGSSSIHLVSTGSYEVQASVDASEVGLIKPGPGVHHRRQRDPEHLRHHDVRGGLVPRRDRGDRHREPADRLQATVRCAPGAEPGDQPDQRNDDRARAERRQAGTPDDHDRAELRRADPGAARAHRGRAGARRGADRDRRRRHERADRAAVPGATVVLADLDEAVPSSSTTTRFGPRARAVTRPGG